MVEPVIDDISILRSKSDKATTENSQKGKSWTIRKVDAKTIEKTKQAAGKSGMKIGAWVDQQLKQAADKSLTVGPSNPLTQDISNLANKIHEKRHSLPEDWVSRIESDIAQLIKGQHNIFLALQSLQNNSKNCSE